MTSKANLEKGSVWDDVQVGDIVRLSGAGRAEYAGEVDARTSDGDIVWVYSPVGGRRLFHIDDGYDLRSDAP